MGHYLRGLAVTETSGHSRSTWGVRASPSFECFHASEIAGKDVPPAASLERLPSPVCGTVHMCTFTSCLPPRKPNKFFLGWTAWQIIYCLCGLWEHVCASKCKYVHVTWRFAIRLHNVRRSCQWAETAACYPEWIYARWLSYPFSGMPVHSHRR